MRDNIGKAERRHFRMLAALAHERELGAALKELQKKFEQWNSGAMDAFDLNAEIHAFHQGISRDLYTAYGYPDKHAIVAKAVAYGVLSEDDVGDRYFENISGDVAYFADDE